MTELRNARADLLARQDEALALNLEDLAKSLGLAKEALPGAIEQITKAVTDILTDVIAKVLQQAATTRAGDVMLQPATTLELPPPCPPPPEGDSSNEEAKAVAPYQPAPVEVAT